ncbi:MAG: hypothetical protein ACWGMZ_04535 [Thermoguttaceae bacterium]
MVDPTDFQTNSSSSSFLSPGEQWAKTPSSSVKKTRLGLSLVFFGTITAIAFFVVIPICLLFMGTKAYNDSGVANVATLFGILMGSFVTIVSPAFCLAVPAESGAKKFLIGSIIFYLICLAYSTVQFIAPTALPEIVFYGGDFFTALGFFMFIIFLKRLSAYVGRNDLSARGKTVLIAYIFIQAALLGVLHLFVLIPFLFFIIAVTMGLIIFSICFVIMYLKLINDLRNTLLKENY